MLMAARRLSLRAAARRRSYVWWGGGGGGREEECASVHTTSTRARAWLLSNNVGGPMYVYAPAVFAGAHVRDRERERRRSHTE